MLIEASNWRLTSQKITMNCFWYFSLLSGGRLQLHNNLVGEHLGFLEILGVHGTSTRSRSSMIGR